MIQRLYIDIDNLQLVGGPSSPRRVGLPSFVQRDTGLIQRIQLLNNLSGGVYAIVPTAGITLQVALGRKVGNATTYYTQQFTWTEGGTLSDPYFEANLPLNTPEIDTLLGASSSKSVVFEVKMIEGGLPKTILSKSVRIEASVIKDGGLQAVAVPTPISAEAANAIFLQRLVIATEDNPLVLGHTNGKRTALYLDTDGTFKTVALA
jgi:hypothetical protein